MSPPCPFCALKMRHAWHRGRQGWRCQCGFRIQDDAKDVTPEQAAEVAAELKR